MRRRVDQARLRQFLGSLGRRLRRSVRFYLVGGSVAIDLGFRSATLDFDYVAAAEDPAALADLEAAIRALKEEFGINVEPSSPADFLPIPSWAIERSRFVARLGVVDVYYYDLASQVIAKAAHGLEQDLADAEQFVRSGHVSWADVADRWAQVRSSPTGWLRHEPADVGRRPEALSRRLYSSGS